MITKVYRIGPTRQRILKSYVVGGENAEDVIRRITSVSWQFKVSQHPRRKAALVVDTGFVWLHTRQAREQLFLNLADFQSKLAGEINRLGTHLLPSGVRSSRGFGRYFLVADQHLIEPDDIIEQTTFCNSLRFNAALLIAMSGRAGVDPTGVESIHSRLVLDGSDFPCRPWLATSSQHIDLVADHLRKSEGIPRLDFLEVTPQNDEGCLIVKTTLMDGQFLLSSVRASALLYQALFLRARRLARSGLTPASIPQHIFERNRSRVAAFGPQAIMQPGHRSAAQELIALIESLRNELQILEAEFEEFQSIVLGLSLRRLGHPALRNENDLFREIMRQRDRNDTQFAAWVSQHLVSAGNADLISAKNHSRQPQLAGAIANSWKQWLASSRQTVDGVGDIRRTPAKTGIDKRHERRDSKERQTSRINPATMLLESLRRVQERITTKNRVEVLDNFSKTTSPEQLGFLASQLLPEQRSELQRLLAPGSDKCKAIQPSSLLWQDPIALTSLQEARSNGMSWFAVESTESDEANLKAWVHELKRQTPADLTMFFWRRRHFGGRVRQELLLTKKNNKSY